MKEEKKPLFCIVGRTASGKDTLTDDVCRMLGLKKVLSATTREKRYKLENTHLFVTKEDFLEDLVEDKVVAHTVINGNIYWTNKQMIEDSDVYIIDPVGLYELKRKITDRKIITVFVYISEEERKKRFLLRQPNQVDLYAARTASENAQFEEFEKFYRYDYIIENNRFEDAVKEMTEIFAQYISPRKEQ